MRQEETVLEERRPRGWLARRRVVLLLSLLGSPSCLDKVPPRYGEGTDAEAPAPEDAGRDGEAPDAADGRDGPAQKDGGDGSADTGCVPSEAGVEVCDGRDDDCDGTIDDGDLCGPGRLCHAGVCLREPTLEVPVETVDFGASLTGKLHPPLHVIVSNSGDLPVPGLSVAVRGRDADIFVLVEAREADCRQRTRLEAGENCHAPVHLGTDVAGRYEAELRFQGDGVAPLSVRLLGARGSASGRVDDASPRLIDYDPEEPDEEPPWGLPAARALGMGSGQEMLVLYETGYPDSVRGLDGEGRPIAAGRRPLPVPGGFRTGEARSVAAGAAGDFWVAGSVAGDAGERLAVWRVRPDGTVPPGFPQVTPEQGSFEMAWGVTGAADGGVWVVGARCEGGCAFTSMQGDVYSPGALVLYRFNADGRLTDGYPRTWAPVESPPPALARGVDVAEDGAGNVWVTGETLDGLRNLRLVLWKFDGEGTLAAGFPKTWSGPEEDGIRRDAGTALALDGAGHVWVAGYTGAIPEGRLLEGTSGLWKFDTEGTLLPGFPLLRGREGWDLFTFDVDLAIDPAGYLWTARTLERWVDEGPDTFSSLEVAKFDPHGDLERGFPIVGSEDLGYGRHSDARALAIAPDGAVWVLGRVEAEQEGGPYGPALWRIE